ncbi:hypothetical protein [Lactobacillus helveticus]|nr:hypothetical protein [Lactobacillus helveticus]
MKHAICIIGYGDKAEIVQKTINVLDDKDIAFLYIGMQGINYHH